jgi:hypothetical protein
MTSAFYDLRADTPYSLAEIDVLQHEGQIDRERQAVERAYRRGDERRLARALGRLRVRRERPER